MAAMTFFISALLPFSAPEAVFAWVVTPNENATRLGTAVAAPEPVTNALANTAELGTIASIAIFIWSHPYITLTIAILVLILLILVVRRIIITLRKLFSGEWRRGVPA